MSLHQRRTVGQFGAWDEDVACVCGQPWPCPNRPRPTLEQLRDALKAIITSCDANGKPRPCYTDATACLRAIHREATEALGEW